MPNKLIAALLALCFLPSLAHAQCGAYLGDKRDSSLVTFALSTYDSTGAGSTVSALSTADVKVYKDSAPSTARANAGYTILGPDINSTTGFAGIQIDLGDNTDANFYQRGHTYLVSVGPFTANAFTTVHCDAFRSQSKWTRP
jgi:hypothetical protein